MVSYHTVKVLDESEKLLTEALGTQTSVLGAQHPDTLGFVIV